MNASSTPASGQTESTARPFSVFGVLLVGWDRFAARFCRMLGTLHARIALWLLGCPCGRGLWVDGRMILRAPRRGSIEIGNYVGINSRFRSNLVGMTQPTILQCLRHGRISIGERSGLSGAVLSARSSITLGRHVMIGGNVRIYDHDWHSVDAMSRRDPLTDAGGIKSAPVFIGDDVFVGANALILKGVNVGARSVIAAGAVVTLKNIPEDSLVAGNPARVVRNLRDAAPGKNAI